MFLQQLLAFNKYLFSGFVLFVLLFVYLNLKWGVIASPVYQYGMYSGIAPMSDPQRVYHIYADGKLINPKELHITTRDVLYSSLHNYAQQKEGNTRTYHTLNRVFGRGMFGGIIPESLYQNVVTDQQFFEWFKRQFTSSVMDARFISVYAQDFVWKNNEAQPLTSPELMFEVGIKP